MNLKQYQRGGGNIEEIANVVILKRLSNRECICEITEIARFYMEYAPADSSIALGVIHEGYRETAISYLEELNADDLPDIMATFEIEALPALEGDSKLQWSKQLIDYLDSPDYVGHAWKEFCDEFEIDRDYDTDCPVAQYWHVTDLFAERLRNHGEDVVDFLDFHCWLRCTAGDIHNDASIAEIAAEMEILVGQRESWGEVGV